MRERLKAARKGDEIVSETVCLQGMRVVPQGTMIVFLLKNEPTSLLCVAMFKPERA